MCANREGASPFPYQERTRTMRQAWALAAAIAALLTIGACTDETGAGFAEPDADELKTHLTAEEFAASLADGVMPNIDWIGWNLEGRPIDRFALELRSNEEIVAEYREKGWRLPNGNYRPAGMMARSREESDLHRASKLVVRTLQPSTCPFVPCVAAPLAEAMYRDVAERMGIPYRFPAELVEEHGFTFTLAEYEEAREMLERDRLRARQRMGQVR